MPDDARRRLLVTAATLMRRQGYAATSVKQLLEESGTVAGSLYHHFPDGKSAIAVAVVEEQAAAVADLLRTVLDRPGTVAEALVGWVSSLQRLMDRSGGLDGCPVAPLAIEAPLAGESLRTAAANAFDSWCLVIQQRLERDGMATEHAKATSILLLSTVEGALLLSRTSGDTTPLRVLCEQLPTLLAATTRS